ncbi:HAMP domain-containing sensor histidine kinase [Alteromonas sp. C1M14]|uniref:sensor histidine kinase n=1 Tax=Alteromonas sp. C1M14 TaxID=2841567 RepID=UPI001C0954B6|nr:HAMP domain-containing sensor histidine kinase [Alteromonas sp. C1M14]MBU2978507.1 HAMP domain-containing histidine kinase [Alteromonas sp. C1M14]
MTTSAVQLSIKSLLLWVIMSIAALASILPACYSTYTQLNHYTAMQKQEVEMLVNMVAAFISEDLSEPYSDSNKHLVNRKLKSLRAAPQVLNVHIYKQTTPYELTLHSSYTKEGETRTNSHAQSIASFFQPVVIDDKIEVSRPIENERGTTAGYIFLQASTDAHTKMAMQTIIQNVVVTLLVLTASFIAALKFQNVITYPIRKLADFLNLTSRQRDYSSRTQPSNIIELTVLSDAVNVMLNRIQEYMHKQKMAEEQHRKLNASLEDMVNQRTLALKDANQELIQTLEKLHQFQRQIVQNEKMASLGDMVAGVAHEVNTPIGLGVTASTMMLDRLTIIQKEFESKTLKASTMARFISESQENLNIIYRNLNRAAELISSFKQVAVDQSSEANRTFCFAQLVNEILLSLRPRLKKLQHNIRVECDPTLEVESKAGPINQILINLIMNSVIHGFEDMEHGEIDIVAQMESPTTLKLIYKDNGKGIPNDIRKRIFDPFVTTKRGQGGSGLGMHLVYNLVTQALNGTISLTSEEGKGVEFVIVFPVQSSDSGNLTLNNE